MASKNQVTLTFAGDSEKLETAFSNVGTAADGMKTKVGESSRQIGTDTSDGFNRASEASDEAEGRFQGLASTLTGTKDTAFGLGQIAKGNLFEGLVLTGQGAADLAEGLNYTVIPTIKNAASAFTRQGLAAGRAKVAMGAHKVATIASAGATKVMTVAQRALNLAMRANPLGIIITLVIAIGTALVVAYKKSATFRRIVQGAMKAVRTAFGWVIDRGRTLLGWFRELPGKIRGFFSGLGETIKKPFTSAFGAIRDFWNSTVGGKGFDVPGWIPGIGGKSFRIPYFHQGGVVGGAPGTETLAMLQAGERVTPAGASQTVTIQIVGDGSKRADYLIEELRRSIRIKGGNVQTVLGAA